MSKSEYVMQIAKAHGWNVIDMPLVEEVELTPIMPTILDPAFRYTRSTRTDVTRTWERHGWQRPDPLVQRMQRIYLNRMNWE